MRPPPEGLRPLLFGPDAVTEGYYELEELERAYVLTCLRHQAVPVELWYRLLTLYRRGMIGYWDFDRESESSERDAFILQSRLLGLGLSTAKSPLDALLAGYYSAAYASIRHMLESYIQCCFLVIRPEESRLWTTSPGELGKQPRTPGCFEMVQTLASHPDFAAMNNQLHDVYKSWNRMSKGSHPSGVGLLQTLGDDKMYFMGAVYIEELAQIGFDHGLSAITSLVGVLDIVNPQSDAWASEVERIRSRARIWRIDQRT